MISRRTIPAVGAWAAMGLLFLPLGGFCGQKRQQDVQGTPRPVQATASHAREQTQTHAPIPRAGGGQTARLQGTSASGRTHGAPAKSKRDPFLALISDAPGKGSGKTKRIVRPPGKAGLLISELDVQGTVRGPRGAVAVVLNPTGHVYFLRAGDRLFDGEVERIDLNGVEFIEQSRDAFGREFDHRVMKSVQPTVGVKP